MKSKFRYIIATFVTIGLIIIFYIQQTRPAIPNKVKTKWLWQTETKQKDKTGFSIHLIDSWMEMN